MKVLHYCSRAFEAVKKVPVLGRVADLATSSLASCFRGLSGSFAAGGLEKCQRPAKLLKLYEFEGCPFCRNVRETLSVLALDVEIYPCPRSTLKAYGAVENSRFREEVTKLGGKARAPSKARQKSGKQHPQELVDGSVHGQFVSQAVPTQTVDSRSKRLEPLTP